MLGGGLLRAQLGLSAPPYAGPLYLDTYKKALDDAGIGYDVYDVDANGRTAPSALGVLCTTTRSSGTRARTSTSASPGSPAAPVSKLFDDEILAVARLHERGRKGSSSTGKFALQGAWDQFLYNPLGAPPNSSARPTRRRATRCGHPAGQKFNCVAVSNDFMQYWLGAYLPIGAAADTDSASALPFLEQAPVRLAGVRPQRRGQREEPGQRLLIPDDVLDPQAGEYPQFESEPGDQVRSPAGLRSADGCSYMFSQTGDATYKRLAKTVDLTGKTSGKLEFKTSYDTEPDWDFLVVEAHTVGQDDWTTLPDANGHTSQTRAAAARRSR